MKNLYREKVCQILNTIIEYEMAGVVRYAHSSLMVIVFKIWQTFSLSRFFISYFSINRVSVSRCVRVSNRLGLQTHCFFVSKRPHFLH